MKTAVYISLFFLNLAFLGGCSAVNKAERVKDSLKNNKANEKLVVEIAASIQAIQAIQAIQEVAGYFVGPPLILTDAHVVELYLDNKEIGKRQNAGNFEAKYFG